MAGSITTSLPFPTSNSKLNCVTLGAGEERTAETAVDGSEREKMDGRNRKGKRQQYQEKKRGPGHILQGFVSRPGAGQKTCFSPRK